MHSVDLASFPESSPNPIIESDSSGIVYYANPTAQRLFPDLISQSCGHPFLSEIKTFFNAFTTSGTDRYFKEIHIGNRFYVQHAYYVPGNRHIRIYGFDVTDKVAAEKSKEDLDQQLKAVFDAIVTPIFIVDGHSAVVRSNPAACAFYGFDMIGGKTRDLASTLSIRDMEGRKVSGDHLPSSRALAGKIVKNEKYRAQDQTGRELIIETSAAPIYENEPARGAVVALHDVTQREKLLADLKEEMDRRHHIELELVRAQENLEERIRLRTVELERVNEILQEKVAELENTRALMAEQSMLMEAFFKNSHSPLVFLDRDFNFIKVNEAYARACRRSIGEFAGHNHFEFYPNEENEAIFRRVVDTKEPYVVSAKPFLFPDHPEWGVTYWDWVLTPILDWQGHVTHLVFALSDVTENKRHQMALEERERLLQTILESLPVGVWIYDEQGRIIHGNRRAYEIWGMTGCEGIGRLKAFRGRRLDTYEEIKDDQWAAVRTIKSGETVLGEEIGIQGFDGVQRVILNSSIPIKNADGRIIGAITVNQDITRRKETEGKILESREHLRALSAELVFAEERERKKISTLLHDRIAQMLAAAKMKLTFLDKDQNEKSIKKTVQDIRKLINQSIRETRSLMMEISPPILYELGLVAALDWLSERMAEEYDFDVRFRHKGNFENLPYDMTVLLFQAVREFLINAGKHSKARRVTVEMNGSENAVEVKVSDNGAGFDVSKIGKPTAEGGFGLFSIKERLKSYEGTVTFRSDKGKGTKIDLKIPRPFRERRQRRTV